MKQRNLFKLFLLFKNFKVNIFNRWRFLHRRPERRSPVRLLQRGHQPDPAGVAVPQTAQLQLQQQIQVRRHVSVCFFYLGHSRPHFIYFRLFYCTIGRSKLIDGRIWTMDLWCQKRPLYQLSHYYFPFFCLLFEFSLLAKFPKFWIYAMWISRTLSLMGTAKSRI